MSKSEKKNALKKHGHERVESVFDRISGPTEVPSLAIRGFHKSMWPPPVACQLHSCPTVTSVMGVC
jgi:hypothetical protein